MLEPIWTIRCYKSESDRNQIKEWYDEQSAAVQAAFDSALSYLENQERTAWVRPKCSALKGDACKGLFEIRFKADKKQIRPLGYFGPSENEFTILFCAIEKGDQFVPKDACKTASKRRASVELDKSKFSCRCFCTGAGFDCCEASEQGVQTVVCESDDKKRISSSD